MDCCKIFILLSLMYLNIWSYGEEIRESEEITDFSKLYSYLKFTQNPNVFAGSKVRSDLKQYTAGLDNEDVFLNISQLIQKYGYNVEEHQVTTEDGYILTIIRTPSEGPVVFLMHGLLMGADDWVVAGPESAIAYSLANEGYDVWMGNARGNKHSRRHEVLSPSTPDFWNFTWDEIGRYDLPAMIDYVLLTRNQTDLLYVGHSQGGTAFFVMCSELPEYNKKISLMVGLASPGAIPHMRSPFLNFLKYITFFHPEMLFALAKEIGIYEFLPSHNLMKTFGPSICGTAKLAEIVCSNVVFMFCGFNAEEQNVTNLPVIFSHTPSGAATKQIEHYSQTVISGQFKRFDYGEARNLEMYGSKVPPEYQIEKITTPTALFYSDNDWLVAYEDVDAVRQRLPNVVDFYRVPLKNFNHVDYLYAKDLKVLVFERLLYLLKQYK